VFGIVGGSGAACSQKAALCILATLEAEAQHSAADPRPPAWKDSQAQASNDPIIKAVTEFGAKGFPNLPWPQMSVVYEELGLAEKKILDGADPTATMQEAAANIKKRTA